jgi:3-oxoacyl-[acyl-carrier protein] reductase
VPKRFKQRRVLVTGAATGIGRAIAILFAQEGARVGIHCYQSRLKAGKLCQDIHREGGAAKVFVGDLTKPEVCRQLVRDFVRDFGGIDVLVNNAGGVYGPIDFRVLTTKDWDKTMALNARAPFFVARETFKIMQANKGGRIINISSIAARYGGSLRTLHYGAAKASLEAITVGLARFGAPHGILVNAVRAGFIDTDFHRKMGRDTRERISRIPLQRPGRPIDVASLVLHLAAEDGSYITGQVFPVTGGD